METIPKYDYMIERLSKGEKVKCSKCSEGIYKPVGKEAPFYWYCCDKCGDHYHIEPIIEVE